MNNCLVTFFYDIERENWKQFSRSSYDYINSFNVMLEYNYEMVVFVDEKYYDIVKKNIENSKYPENKKIIPINEKWLEKNIWSWGKLEREKEIMSSEYYMNLVQHRINNHYPENTNPKYTILTHSKIDFVNYVVDNNLTNCDIVSWVDFGYFQNKSTPNFRPNNVLDLNKFDLNKINICLINDIDEYDKDIIYTLKNSPEKIGAYFFLGDKNNMKKFQSLCHEWLVKYQELNISDDEQSLWLQCYFQNQDLFKKHVFGKWHMALKHFSI